MMDSGTIVWIGKMSFLIRGLLGEATLLYNLPGVLYVSASHQHTNNPNFTTSNSESLKTWLQSSALNFGFEVTLVPLTCLDLFGVPYQGNKGNVFLV